MTSQTLRITGKPHDPKFAGSSFISYLVPPCTRDRNLGRELKCQLGLVGTAYLDATMVAKGGRTQEGNKETQRYVCVYSLPSWVLFLCVIIVISSVRGLGPWALLGF